MHSSDETERERRERERGERKCKRSLATENPDTRRGEGRKKDPDNMLYDAGPYQDVRTCVEEMRSDRIGAK